MHDSKKILIIALTLLLSIYGSVFINAKENVNQNDEMYVVNEKISNGKDIILPYCDLEHHF